MNDNFDMILPKGHSSNFQPKENIMEKNINNQKININGRISISRASNGKIYLELRDVNSRIKFLELEINPEELALCLTGLSEQDCIFTLKNVENVGKKLIVEKRSVVYEGKEYLRGELENWILENCKEEGWIIDNYLRGQGSVRKENDKTILNYVVKKYV